MKESLYLNLLRTIKNQNYIGKNDNSFLSRNDLLLLPTISSLTIAMNKILINYPFTFLLNCLFHPENPVYYEQCPLDETCTILVIISSFSLYKPFLRSLYSSEIILYFCKFLFLSKCLFLGTKKMINRQIILLFHGIKSAILSLSEFISCLLYDEDTITSFLSVIKETSLIDQSILFFLNTLSDYGITKLLQDEKNLTTDPEKASQLYYTLQLQKEIGICCLKFLTNYGKLVNVWSNKGKFIGIADLLQPGIRVVNVSRVLFDFVFFVDRWFLVMSVSLRFRFLLPFPCFL
jgi:hypothetical protein